MRWHLKQNLCTHHLSGGLQSVVGGVKSPLKAERWHHEFSGLLHRISSNHMLLETLQPQVALLVGHWIKTGQWSGSGCLSFIIARCWPIYEREERAMQNLIRSGVGLGLSSIARLTNVICRFRQLIIPSLNQQIAFWLTVTFSIDMHSVDNGLPLSLVLKILSKSRLHQFISKWLEDLYNYKCSWLQFL